MKKDTYLLNIYLKIHNKTPLTMDDLQYLAKYDVECFEKTCKNVVYNLPETKAIMEAEEPVKVSETAAQPEAQKTEPFNVKAILNNLKKLEADKLFFSNIDSNRVKNLLGNLYMELLFPHTDQDDYFQIADELTKSSFDFKA